MQDYETVTEAEAIVAGKYFGVAGGLPAETYHAAPYLGSSSLALFEENPALYRSTEVEVEETDSMRIGTLLHMRLLEPDRFARDTVLIEGNGNANVVKEAIALAESEGKTIFRKRAEQEQIEGMAASVMRRNWARRLILSGEQEKSYFATHPVYGFPMKCRADAVHEDLRVIADLKTITPKVPALPMKMLERKVRDMNYDVRAIHYLTTTSLATGRTFDRFALVWVSTIAPYPVRVTSIGGATSDRAAERLTAIYEKYGECYRTDTWPDYPDDIEELELFFL
jgi:exodeoxyribonuclease VIII